MKIVKSLIIIMLAVLGLSLISAQDGATGDNPLPEPTGPYAVGVTYREWIDESREEPFTEDQDDKRIMSVFVYYPADVEDGVEPAPYLMDESLILGIMFYAGELPNVVDPMIAELRQWQSHIYRDPPILQGETFPVVLFNSSFALERGLQAVDLASHGYVVVEVNTEHLYERSPTDRGNKIGDTEVTLRELMEIKVQDNIAAINYLESLTAAETGDELGGIMDMTNIGVAGLSIHGGVAWETAHRDDRIDAGMSIDGVFWISGIAPLDQPFMYTHVTYSPTSYYRRAEVPAYVMEIEGFVHDTPTDWLFWPYASEHPAVKPTGLTPQRAHEIHVTYLRAFFDEYLKGIEQPLLDGPSDDFPEVTIESRNTE